MAQSRDAVRLLVLGFGCLVVSSLCDSLRAPALPLLAERFASGYGRLSTFLTAGSVGSLAFNLLALRALSGLSDRAVVALAAGLQAAAMLLAAAAPGLGTLAVSGLLWGAGNGGLGMGSNLLVMRATPASSRARVVSLLHVFYGISCVFPPLYVAAVERAGGGPMALLAAPALLPALLLAATAVLPGGRAAALGTDAAAPAGAPWRLASVVALYVLGEVLTSMWMVAILTAKGMGLPEAGRVLSGFFLALAAGRVASAAFVRPGAERVLVPLGLVGGAAGTLLGASGSPWGFWLAGALFGPLFPLLITRVSVERGARLRESLAFVYALMVVALGLGHQAMGWTAEAASPSAAALLPAACLLAGLAAWLL
ncbi:MAG: hypothetical protein HYZ75_19940 [Elusimicrobia bacterium]|nr:hypothetical protein [Elusimicrobiota bacterium]